MSKKITIIYHCHNCISMMSSVRTALWNFQNLQLDNWAKNEQHIKSAGKQLKGTAGWHNERPSSVTQAGVPCWRVFALLKCRPAGR